MRAEIVAIIVHDEKLFFPTGVIGRWADQIGYEFKWNTIFAAPTNKRAIKSRANAAEPVGSLRAGIDADVRKVSARRLHITLTSSASYSQHVLFGTGRIYSRSARIPKGEAGAGQFTALEWGTGGMYIPAGMGHKPLLRQSVSGQKANNFIEKGFKATGAAHSSLRSMRFS